jgi:hypothetical protein
MEDSPFVIDAESYHDNNSFVGCAIGASASSHINLARSVHSIFPSSILKAVRTRCQGNDKEESAMKKAERITQVAAIMIFAAIIAGGCGHESSYPAAPEALAQSSTLAAPAPTLQDVNLQPSAEAATESPAQEMDPARDLDNERPVTECGVMGGQRGYYQYSAPWPDSWTAGSAGNIFTINASTGVGRAYARCRPNDLSYATCGVRNAAPGRAWRWVGSNRNINVVMYTPSRMVGELVNGGLGATAGTYVEVKEYDTNGRYVQTYSRTAYSLTGYPVRSFNVDLNGYYATVPVRTNYMYVTSVYATASARSGGAPPGSTVDITSAQLKSFLFGF